MSDDAARSPSTSEAIERFINAASRGDAGEAHVFVDTLLDSGWSVERIVEDLVAAVQRSMGSRWQSGRVGVAREHTATSVVDEVLGSLGRHAPEARHDATLVLVSAEGEWHVTPTRMAALLFRRQGWSTACIAGSTPPADLRRAFETSSPTFVGVSCTHTLALSGAERVVRVARGLGIPTIAGGQAFGSDDRRAQHLGADGWASDVSGAGELLTRWLDSPPEVEPAPPDDADEPRPLEARWEAIADQAIPRLMNVDPPVLRHGEQSVDDLRRDLVNLLRAAYLTRRCEDPTLFADYVDWLLSVHPPRGLPHEAVRPSIRVLRALNTPLAETAPAS